MLTVSRYFPTTHKRKGESTFFVEKINEALIPVTETSILGKKLHTIRSNYEIWDKRIKEVQEGKAILSIRYWSGKPYNSKQVEICQLDADSGCGVQKILFDDYLYTVVIDDKRYSFSDQCIAEHDGLSEEDFENWFYKYDFSKPMAIIHFTSFRY